jgi:HSP20 family molecular chaperone IbpA
MYETTGALVIIAPLPAVMPDDVTIDLRANLLRIKAQVRSAGVREYLVHEWDYGGYEREVSIPEGFGAGMEASLANGQLAVRVLRGDPLNSLTIQPDRG